MKLVLSHPGIGEVTVTVGAAGLVVGRQGGSADLEMNWDGRVSRRHARFWLTEGELWLEDLGSRNGTWLETQRLEAPLRILPGMRVAVGETWFWLAPLDRVVTDGIAVATEPAGAVEEQALESTLKAYAPEDEDDVRNTAEIPVMRASRSSPGMQAPGFVPGQGMGQPVRATTARSVPLPQLASDAEVVLRADRESLSSIWVESLSKGALFVPTDRPPSGRVNLTLRIETPGGSLELGAEVVHVIDATSAQARGQSPGIGLHITELTPENRAAIHRYATGQTERLERPEVRATQRPQAADVEPVLAKAREFITRVEANDLYAALGIPPTSNEGELRKRILELRASFSSVQGATPPQLARLAGAVRLLDRAATTLGDPIRRLEYDFRRGDVRAEERIMRSKDGTGAPLTLLREAWTRSFPEDVEAAAALAKKATTAKRSREMLLAVETMRAAIRLDPFHDELRDTVRAWESQLPRKSG